jgi:hypothetical protein
MKGSFCRDVPDAGSVPLSYVMTSHSHRRKKIISRFRIDLETAVNPWAWETGKQVPPLISSLDRRTKTQTAKPPNVRRPSTIQRMPYDSSSLP